jgi:hypothetical protein
MQSPFKTCWDRVDRAEVHRQSLAKLWNGLDTNSDYVSSAKMNDDGTGKFFITPVKTDWLLPFSLEFGEMLYHLRSALDSCVYDAAILELKSDPPPDEQKWMFPVAADPAKFAEAVKRMPKITDDMRRILETVQPYTTTTGTHEGKQWDIGPVLSILNDWARIDRHRKLHLVGTTLIDGKLGIGRPPEMAVEYCNFMQGNILEDQGEIAEFKLSNFVPGTKIHMDTQFTLKITVDETPRCELEDISIAMMLSVQVVREIFERHYGIKR